MTDLNPELLASLSPAEQATARNALADLHGRGYRTVETHKGLRPGVRIRLAHERFPEAYADGTGVVLVVTTRDPSGWSDVYGRADVELLVVWDKPNLADTRLSQVAQYHVDVIGGAR